MNARNRLVIVIEYDCCGNDNEQSLFDAMTQIREGQKRLNKKRVQIVQVHTSIGKTASQVLNIFSRPGHDSECEWGTPGGYYMGGLAPKVYTKEECQCAVRAYERDPLPQIFDPEKG